MVLQETGNLCPYGRPGSIPGVGVRMIMREGIRCRLPSPSDNLRHYSLLKFVELGTTEENPVFSAFSALLSLP